MNEAFKDNTVIIVLGAAGDIARKKTFPALFSLYCRGLLPRDVKTVGYARTKMSSEEYSRRLASYIKIADKDSDLKAKFEEFKALYSHVSGTFDDGASFDTLNEHISTIEALYQTKQCNRLFYIALPPNAYISVAEMLKKHCYVANGINRIILEQPFGSDLDSSSELTGALKQYWTEDETFRIDHFLGKEMMRSILSLRFANIAWDKNSVANVQISHGESFGTEGRGRYFDETGIIRDVMQNHLLQILSILTMERPVSFAAEDIRDEKVKVLRCITPVRHGDALLGQYVAANGKPGYLDDNTVPPKSTCPTFAACALEIHNSRWEGVPFILKAGRALNESKIEIRVQFKEAAQDELVIRIQPSEAIYLKLNTKTSGLNVRAIPAEMDLMQKKSFADAPILKPYEALILEALRGYRANFVRSDELEVAWEIFTPILQWIKGDGADSPPHTYPYGSQGPSTLDGFMRKYGCRPQVN